MDLSNKIHHSWHGWHLSMSRADAYSVEWCIHVNKWHLPHNADKTRIMAQSRKALGRWCSMKSHCHSNYSHWCESSVTKCEHLFNDCIRHIYKNPQPEVQSNACESLTHDKKNCSIRRNSHPLDFGRPEFLALSNIELWNRIWDLSTSFNYWRCWQNSRRETNLKSAFEWLQIRSRGTMTERQPAEIHSNFSFDYLSFEITGTPAHERRCHAILSSESVMFFHRADEKWSILEQQNNNSIIFTALCTATESNWFGGSSCDVRFVVGKRVKMQEYVSRVGSSHSFDLFFISSGWFAISFSIFFKSWCRLLLSNFT